MKLDDDIHTMTQHELMNEVQKLRDGIRDHRDCQGHELCWYHPELWGLLPEKTDPVHKVPEWSEFITRCVCYRRSFDGM